MPYPVEHPTTVVVTVERTGGFAGLTRRWHVSAQGDGTAHWITLISACPWPPEESVPDPAGADRFVWLVAAEQGDDHRQARLGDGELDDAWRELIDAVRAASAEPSAVPTEE